VSTKTFVQRFEPLLAARVRGDRLPEGTRPGARPPPSPLSEHRHSQRSDLARRASHSRPTRHRVQAR
jgi:hypothetical protein